MREAQLNSLGREEAHVLLETVRGIGYKTVHKILEARDIGGDFLSGSDFDRRIKGLTWNRIENLCLQAGVQLSLAASTHQQRTKSISTASPLKKSSHFSKHDFVPSMSSDPQDCITVCTWNTCHLSSQAMFYDEKLNNVFRLVNDSNVDILCLQEISKNEAQQLAARLSLKFSTSWREFSPSRSGRAILGDKSLSILYNAKKISIKPRVYKHWFHSQKLKTFHRVPQVGFVYKNGRLVSTVVHVHLSQADPRKEIHRLAHILRKVDDYVKTQTNSQVTQIVLGDFNLNSDARSFDHMRKQAMVELVGPNRNGSNGYETTNHQTTIGGSWLDNVWISESSREHVVDAWCFEFGGRCRSILQSGHQYASRKRAMSSDHLPVVAMISYLMNEKTRKLSNR